MHFPFSIKLINGVQTSSLKLLLLLIDPSGFFRQARASSKHRDYINEVINFTSVERSVYMKERFTVSCLKANMDCSQPSSVAQFSLPCCDRQATLINNCAVRSASSLVTAYLAAFPIENSYKAMLF